MPATTLLPSSKTRLQPVRWPNLQRAPTTPRQRLPAVAPALAGPSDGAAASAVARPSTTARRVGAVARAPHRKPRWSPSTWRCSTGKEVEIKLGGARTRPAPALARAQRPHPHAGLIRQRVLLVGDPAEKCKEVAASYGLKHVTHYSDYARAHPTLNPFRVAREAGTSHTAVANKSAAAAPKNTEVGEEEPFASVLVMSDPYEWYKALQVHVLSRS